MMNQPLETIQAQISNPPEFFSRSENSNYACYATTNIL